ncbi:MAG: response regulator [Bacteroidales bacterium]|jgi:ligand-binding sensor domain-containing protein/signal transduction histidine kinase/AraC-like DNA-binding protein|nr:response regulator [Bacteroidales bacterium]
MLKKPVVFFIILLCPYFVFSQRDKVQFEHLSVKDGLSQLSVVSLFQDSQGFMWFGTRNGLNKYDGYNFHIFRESDQDNYISNGHIECMAEDQKKRLWVGTRRGLNRYDTDSCHFIQYYRTENDSSISDNNVICMLKDYRGTLWLGTARGLNRYLPATDNFERCTFKGLSPDLTIYALAEDHDENLWIGTSNGLFVYNSHTKEIQVYKHDPLNNRSIAHDRISALFCDSKGRIWVGFHQQSLCLYNTENNDFKYFGKNDGLNENIRCIEEDKENNILVGTFDGLSFYDERNKRFTSAYNSGNNDMVPMSNFSVYDVLCDRAGTVWVGTYSGGVSYYSAYNQRFRFHDPGMQGKMLFGIIGPTVEHTTGMWIGTEGGGLLFFDRNDGSYTYFRLPAASQRAFSRNIVKSLLIDGDYLWVGSTHNTIYRFDIQKRRFDQSISPSWGNIQYTMLRDDNKNLWIGASGGNALGYLSDDGQQTHPLPLKNGQVFNPSNVRCMLEDSTGLFYIGSSSTGLYFYNSHTKTQKRYSHRANDDTSLASDRITSICKTKDNRILWISTHGGGISRLNMATGQFDNYDKRHGLASNTVYAIVEDRDGKLWLSTAAGISRFDPATKTFSNYDKNNGIQISEFTPGSGVVTSDNEVFFGGNNGFVSFYPHQIKINNYVPPVYITKVLVNNQALGDHVLGNPLKLNYKQSNITVEFSALNYIYPDLNKYAYKLEGFDKQWNEVGNRRTAYYTNIQPGSYTFHVKGSNNDGLWNEQGAVLSVSISPPPWNTWWAWFIYVSIVATGIFLVVRSSRIRTQLRNNIRIKQIEQENMEELHQTKIKLFTNFSHELRTPLTLILTPLEDILQNNGLSPKLHDALRLMHKNANRLLYTVSQLMDFRKKESGHLQLKAAKGNIVKFTNEIFIAFNELAHSRNIDFSFVCGIENQQLWYDRDLLEKVLFNLLSNAFKNTPNGGKIVFTLSLVKINSLKRNFGPKVDQLPVLDDFVLISVSDTGTGIPDAELEKIFNPFYQVHQKGIPQPFGTGIGLNLSKGVIDLHHGAIWAANVPDSGAIFRIVLPVGKSHLKESDLEPDFKNSEDSSHYSIADTLDTALPSNTEMPDEKPAHSVLIVEDNADVRHYIHSHLGKYYITYEAENGKDAFDIAVEQLPDLIVSDIMMPVMDGIELCHRLKNDLRTGHIPVILLTARVTVMQVQEGFEIGADDYITKPFNAGLLVTRIKNLIASRERLRELFGQKSSFAFPELPTSSVDSRFMDSVYKYINDHLADPDLNMDDFCKEIGMSRSNFYRKIKTLSDLTSNELIRNTRLQFAAKYIRETDMSISEIAYNVGFSSPSYFTKTFRTYFKMAPSEMKEGKDQAQ